MWLASSRVLPIIMLVVIPISASILAITLSDFVPLIYTGVTEEFATAFSYIYLISVSSLVYAIYPIRYRNIERRGISDLSIEQTYIKNILYVEVPILIFVILIVTAQVMIPYFPYAWYFRVEYLVKPFVWGEDFLFCEITQAHSWPPEQVPENRNITELIEECFRSLDIIYDAASYIHLLFNAIMINLGFSITAGIIWMILVAIRKDLGYYIARSIFQTITQESEASKKAKCLIKAIRLYDKYLRRTLNLEFNDAKKIYSKILSDPNLNENESIQQISESFNSSNKLEPIKCLSKIMNVKDDKDPFLVDESIGKRLKDMAIFFATIIPVVVTVIQLLLQK
jgi:hypothetical protein